MSSVSVENFDERPDLIKKIQEELEDGNIAWRLQDVSQRLVYVPETRQEYVKMFEDYCNSVIGDILEITGLENPITKIYTPGDKQPEMGDGAGIHALIVHNMAKEYIAGYIFSNEASEKKVKVELKGKVLTGEVGFYSSFVYLDKEGICRFIENPYTVWKNNADNDYTLLSTPVEETLHIILRTYTQNTIKEEIEKNNLRATSDIKTVVDKWISVEEAIVGGLVHTLLPPVLEKRFLVFPQSLIRADIETKNKFSKYRHLKNGIRVVNRLGFKKSLEIYKRDPAYFHSLVM